MKTCWRCKRELNLNAFNRDRSRRDGLQGKCRQCQIDLNRDWAERNPETRRAAMRRRYRRHPNRESKKCRHPGAGRAHSAVDRAVRNGELVRPDRCPECGSAESTIHAHHDDYSKPLAVQWMCARCHGRLHAAHPGPAA